MADTDNVTVGAQGWCYLAPVGTTGPADIVSDWPTGWADTGFVTDDGLAEALSEDETSFNAWGYNAPVRVQPKSRTVTFKLTFEEVTAPVLSLYYSVEMSDMTTVGSGEDIGVSFSDPVTATSVYTAMGLDIIDEATGRQFRYIIPRAKVSDRDNITDKPDALHDFGMTFTALVPLTGGTPVQRMISKVPIPA